MKKNEYSAFAEQAPSTEGLANLSLTAIALYEAEMDVIKAQAQVLRAQERVVELSERILPELMDTLKLKELKLTNGTTLKVDDILQIGSVTKNPDVLKWLEDSGHGSKIKRTVSVSLGKDADKQEKQLLEELTEEGFTDVTSLRWVESQTLKAHVKGVLEAGGELDMELLGVRQFKKAKIAGKAEKSESVFGE